MAYYLESIEHYHAGLDKILRTKEADEAFLPFQQCAYDARAAGTIKYLSFITIVPGSIQWGEGVSWYEKFGVLSSLKILCA